MNHKILDKLVNLSFDNLEEHAAHTDKCHTSYVVCKGIVLAVGHNKPRKTHPRAAAYEYPTIHSELDAVLRVPRGTDLSRCTLVNIRLSISSLRLARPILRMSKPCQYCLGLIQETGLKEVVFTHDHGWAKLI